MKNAALDRFFRKIGAAGEALTYEDVRLRTDHSSVLPKDVDLHSRFSRNVSLNIPVVSAAMDRVTEYKMAIALAKYGGLGVIHKNMTPPEQALSVARVKHYLNGLIESPICIDAKETIEVVLRWRDEKGYTFHTFPVTEKNILVGLMTRNDFDFASDKDRPVRDVMTPLRELMTAPSGTSIKEAYVKMQKGKKKVLPLTTKGGKLAGMYVFSDLERILAGNSSSNTDKAGNLRVAAAIGVGEMALERAKLLSESRCDVFVIDTAHGDSENVFQTIKKVKARYSRIDIVAGNVSRGESAKRLAKAGADGVLVGQGPGSICTTRIISGIGTPQVSAVYDCAKALRGSGVPVCADGGISNSGDMVVALGVGAESVMLGRLLAGSLEAPGETRIVQGMKVKDYRGMGSIGAMRENIASRERYRQGTTPLNKLVPEGVEALVPFSGSVSESLDQYVGGIRSGMGYIGAHNIGELRRKAEIFRITPAGLKESHPHDLLYVEDAPNYRRKES